MGICVAPLVEKEVARGVSRFVQKVHEFKHQELGDGDMQQLRQTARTYETYRREFSGRKTGRRSARIDYITWHGEVVEKLKQRLEKRQGVKRVINDPYRDLCALTNDGREVYEVKTETDRQSLYAAIGQLTVHGDGAKQVLVIPEGDVPREIMNALKRLRIRVLRFSISKGKAKIGRLPRL